jgi:hypothetical protein
MVLIYVGLYRTTLCRIRELTDLSGTETEDLYYIIEDQAKFEEMRRRGELLEWTDIYGFS